jgi:hypothetical protein
LCSPQPWTDIPAHCLDSCKVPAFTVRKWAKSYVLV